MTTTTTTAIVDDPPLRPLATADEVAELVARLQSGPSSWRPRAASQTLGGVTYHRVYLGNGSDAYLYPAGGGRWRATSAVPVFWRRDLDRVLGDLFDTAKRPGGRLMTRVRR